MNQIKIFNELIRLKQITGTLLLIFPCLFSITHLYKIYPDLNFSDIILTTILFVIGAFLMRSAGCIINDLTDRNFDKNVNRTKNRPIASNQISVKSAIAMLIILLIFAFLILIQFNSQTIISGFVALALVAIYPLMKRITYLPQLFLGITFNFGIIMSSLALTSNLDFGTIIIYLASITWTLFYDTIYGFQDIEDDLKIGIKSSAIKFSKSQNPRIILHKIAIISTLLFMMVGVYEEFGKLYFSIIIINGFYMNLKLYKCNLKDPKSCLKLFKLNIFFGLLILTALILG